MQKEQLLQVNNHFQLQFEEKQDCFVILYPEGMVQLSQSAGEIMNLCNGNNTALKISEILENKFETKDLINDVCDFLDEAMRRGWVKYEK